MRMCTFAGEVAYKLPELVDLLSTATATYREHAAVELSKILQHCGMDLSQTIIGAGAASPLVPVLIYGSEAAQRAAASALVCIFCRDVSVARIELRRTAAALSCGPTKRALRGIACLTQELLSTCTHDYCLSGLFDAMVAAGFVPVLTALLSPTASRAPFGRDEAITAAASELLGTIFSECSERHADANAAVHALAAVLWRGSDAEQSAALAAIQAVCQSGSNSIDLEETAMDAILHVMHHGSHATRAAAGRTLEFVTPACASLS